LNSDIQDKRKQKILEKIIGTDSRDIDSSLELNESDCDDPNQVLYQLNQLVGISLNRLIFMATSIKNIDDPKPNDYFTLLSNTYSFYTTSAHLFFMFKKKLIYQKMLQMNKIFNQFI
jgi:hypothetical protein